MLKFRNPVKNFQTKAIPARGRQISLQVRNSSMNDFLIQQSYIIGKGMTLFVLFTTTMNWWFYKRTREDIEKIEEKKKEELQNKKQGKQEEAQREEAQRDEKKKY